MKYFISLYNSFLISLVISLILFNSEWLEMRVNIGLIFFGIWILLFVILSVFSRKNPKLGFIFTLNNLIVCFIISFILYGINRLLIVPASIIREGLHITSISFTSINTVIAASILIGLVLILFNNKSTIKSKRLP